MRFCDQCSQPCKPRKDRPGRFFALCEEHYAEEKRQANRESYRRFKEQRLQKNREWRSTNAGHLAQANRTYYVTHKEEEIRKALSWAKDHPGGRKTIEKRYRSQPRGKATRRRNDHHRRARELGAPGFFTEEQWQDRLDFYGRRCYLCGCDWDALPLAKKTIDHVIPLSRGGTNWPANLRPACRSCNSSKNARMPGDGYVPGVG